MNNPFGYAWLPTQRSSSNGLINLPHGAVKMANNARYMIMAAGNNPATGGINEYAYVYRISLESNHYKITYTNEVAAGFYAVQPNKHSYLLHDPTSVLLKMLSPLNKGYLS